MHQTRTTSDWLDIKARIRQWGRELGFTELVFAPSELDGADQGLAAWLEAGYQGEMDYMARHARLRANPVGLLAGCRSVICVRLDYLPEAADPRENLADPARATISRYALGRDYHKLLRQRLQALAVRMTAELGAFAHRACTDSAPVMEVELARRGGLGWRGKHTLLLSRRGSWFFLGELLTDLPIPADLPEPDLEHGHCGTCRACLNICPTRAILSPYVLDARLCISYLTIEHAGPIPEALRPLLGNRIYGCDDCQLVCPWNRHAPLTREADFAPRHGLDRATLVELFGWTERQFLDRLAGSAIRRIGHERWLRNIAVALGNATASSEVIAALDSRRDHPSALVREHVAWALQRLQSAHD
ncbi:MAG TPA: tRNA epoxyqueuosine(34) reductase QueG [Thiobacillaceae bacterium]|nr:tRNA epoxyqueuosine(34) reductase QueG [Thiobacillaceae bacterium]